MKSNTTAISTNTSAIIDTRDSVRDLEKRVDRNEKQLDDRIVKVVTDLAGAGAASGSFPSLTDTSGRSWADFSGPSTMPPPQDLRREDQYLLARRSLRAWPVPGPDHLANLKVFLVDNLAAEGRAAGVRMQVPGYLISTFRLLENLGYQMKKVDPDVRRVVKFDDSKMSLMMDVRVNDSWRRVYPDDAKKAMARTPNLSAAAGPAEMSSDNISDFFTQTPASGANAEPMQ